MRNQTSDSTSTIKDVPTCGGDCSMTVATLPSARKGRPHNPRRTLYKARDYAPAPGARPEPVKEFAHELQRKWRRIAQRYRKKPYVVKMPDCPKDCYCDDMIESPPLLKKVTLPIGELKKESVRTGIIKPDPQNPKQEEQIRSGKLTLKDISGKPLKFDPEIDILGDCTLLCCATYDGYISYNIERRYLYQVDFEAEWRYVTSTGRCSPYPEWAV